MNEQGRILFENRMVGGDVLPDTSNSLAFYCWDATTGLQLVARSGDQVQLAPGDVRTVSTFGGRTVQQRRRQPPGLQPRRTDRLARELHRPGERRAGSIVSSTSRRATGPSIVTQPSNVLACLGAPASLSVLAAGVPAPTYQWTFNGSPLSDGGGISGSATATLTINPVAASDLGTYACVLSGSCGTVTTSPATLALDTTDTDADGTPNCTDGCPSDPAKIAPGVCGCGVADTDTDLDATPDCIDGCPNDPAKIAPGACGCGVADTDTDLDGTPDCIDGCPGDPAKIAPGACGCGVADTDSDGDATPDCIDGCPNDPAKIAPGACGCGVADTDSDGDGTPDCTDGCPGDPAKTAPGQCGCGIADTDGDGDGTADCNDGCPTTRRRPLPANAAAEWSTSTVTWTVSPTASTTATRSPTPGSRTPTGTASATPATTARITPTPASRTATTTARGDACAIAQGAPDCNNNAVPDSCDLSSGSSQDSNGNAIPDECEGVLVPFCLPGHGGVIACPCNNPPVAPGLGCDNFGAGPAESGRLDATGVASLGADTVVLQATGENNTSLNVFFAGTARFLRASSRVQASAASTVPCCASTPPARRPARCRGPGWET
jgi:hypothetical protein